MRYVIGFSRSNSLFSKGITWLTRSEVSHTYIRQISSAGDYVLEATHGGVAIQWGRVWSRRGAIVVDEFVVPPDDMGLLNRAWDHVIYSRLNRPYSYAQIVGDAYVQARWMLTGYRPANPFGQPWSDVCSELTLAFLIAIDADDIDGFKPDIVTPEELYQWAKTQPGYMPEKQENDR